MWELTIPLVLTCIAIALIVWLAHYEDKHIEKSYDQWEDQ